MNALTQVPHQMYSLLEVVQLKWLLAGEGVHLHVERLMSDPVYAEQALQREVAAITTEAQQELAASFQIRSIPTIAVIREGVMVFRESGALPASALDQVIEGVRGLDMDAVRAEVAAQQDGEQAGQQAG